MAKYNDFDDMFDDDELQDIEEGLAMPIKLFDDPDEEFDEEYAQDDDFDEDY